MVKSISTNFSDIPEMLNSHDEQLAEKTYISVFDYGAKGDGSTDDTTAIQNAINATPVSGTLLIGNHRLHGALTIPNEIRIKGKHTVNGNDTGTSVKSQLYFDQALSACITSNGKNLYLEDCIIAGNNKSATIGIQITNASLITEKVTIQMFNTGVSIQYGYYVKLNNSYIGYCNIPLVLDNCYNANALALMMNNNPNDMQLKNGTYLRMFGGSVEGFGGTSPGISVLTSSSLDLFGTYFEGVSGTDNSCVLVDSGSSLNAIGCQAYLTQCVRFVDARSKTGYRIFSRNNRFDYPTNNNAVTVYDITQDGTSYVDIAGDQWQTTAGANVIYTGMSLPIPTIGQYKIIFPANHPKAKNPIDNTYKIQGTDNSVPTGITGMMVMAKNNGTGTNADPIGIVNNYGYNPYMAIFQGSGQWEKVGIRLPNQANTSGATLAQLETELNTLKTNLRNNGIMI